MNGVRNTAAESVAFLAKRWGLDVYRYCRKLLASDAEAEDAMQMVFLQAVEGYGQVREPGAERRWLLSIAKHRCLDRLKVLRRRTGEASEQEEEAMEVAADGPGAEQLMAESQAAKVLSECLDQLPAPTRVAIVLRYHEHLPYEAIEAETGMSAGALRVRVLRGLVQLKECLEGRGVSW